MLVSTVKRLVAFQALQTSGSYRPVVLAAPPGSLQIPRHQVAPAAAESQILAV